jgi:hypothetical protein
MNVHVCSLRYFPKDDLFFSLTTTQMEGWKFEQLELKGHKPIYSKPRMEMNLSYWPLYDNWGDKPPTPQVCC